MLKIEKLSNGSLLVKRHRKRRVFACVWAQCTPEETIRKAIAERTAKFHPFDETTYMFL